MNKNESEKSRSVNTMTKEIERLKSEIKQLKKRKKYGIVWEPKPEDVAKLCKEKLPVVKEVKNREIVTDKNKPINLLIEGDNYHSLSVLNYTHKGAIDVIYIDPPYNTGNEDFTFNDHYVDREDAYRHSKWLSFMELRLKLAKNLLKNNGIIFISIDDNELAQLKLLCDEPAIFGEKNVICVIIWQKVYSPKNQSKRISIDQEYIISYAKNIDYVDFNLLPRTEKMDKRYKNPDNDPRGPWQSGDLIANEERKHGHYTVKGPLGDEFDAPSGKHWAYSKENLLEFIKDNRVWFGKTGKSFPRLKQFLSEVQQGRKASTLFLHDEVGHSDEAKKELKSFFKQSEKLFSTPKPTRLIKQLLRLCQNKDATILDFMAGSGTTGHAVLELNKEDGGNRMFILCTNNENNICTEVCYPRIEKVINGYTAPNKEKIKGLGGNLKYFKTDFVDAEPTDKNKKKLTEQAIEMLCIREGTFELVLNREKFKIFKNSDHYTGIIFDQLSIPEFKKAIKEIKGKFSIYVFSLSDETFEEEFADVKQKIKLSPIPEAILRVYRRIFK